MASNYVVTGWIASISILLCMISWVTNVVSNPVVILPLYIYPYPQSTWSTILTSLSANPSLQVIAVINPSSAPGPGPFPNSDFIQAIASLNSHPNLQTICYIHTSVATQPTAEVMEEINICAGWATYLGADIHMGEIFFDEAPYIFTVAAAAYMRKYPPTLLSYLALAVTL